MVREENEEYYKLLRSRVAEGIPNEMAEKMVSFALSKEEHDAVLDRIKDYVFRGKKPVKNPKIFLVVSQTGGGKSNLTRHILDANPNTVVIDSDAFKAFNPRSKEIAEKYPTEYGFLTGLDAYLHRDEVYSEALEEGYNILIEIAPSNKDLFFNVDFEELEKYGYTVDANVLAVSKINSLLSIHERFEGQIEAKMASPKLTDLRRAKESYEAVEKVVDVLSKMKNTELKIWKRNTNCEKNDGKELPPPILVTDKKTFASDALKTARVEDEGKTLENADERIKTIEAQMKKRNAPTKQRAQFEEIKSIIYEVQNEKH